MHPTPESSILLHRPVLGCGASCGGRADTAHPAAMRCAPRATALCNPASPARGESLAHPRRQHALAARPRRLRPVGAPWCDPLPLVAAAHPRPRVHARPLALVLHVGRPMRSRPRRRLARSIRQRVYGGIPVPSVNMGQRGRTPLRTRRVLGHTIGADQGHPGQGARRQGLARVGHGRRLRVGIAA